LRSLIKGQEPGFRKRLRIWVGFNGDNGNFNADGVNLANGDDNWDNNVTNDNPVAVCVP
jgi:hypothetical protein